MKAIILIAGVLVVLGGAAAFVLRSSEPQLTVNPPVKVIGIETPIHVRVQNKRGIRNVVMTLEQDGKPFNLRAAEGLLDAEPHDIVINTGKKLIPSLHDGKARITIAAASNDFRGKTATQSFDVDVITAPPQVVADGAQHYINQGGSELVTFKPSGAWTEAGVQVGDYKFRSFPLPNHPGEYFSLFAFAWNLPVDTPMSVYASNPSGATARASFTYKLFPKKFRASTLSLESMNLDRMVNQIDPEHKVQGEMVQRFVSINNDMRKQNNKTLSDLRFQTEPKFLWTGAFLPMVDSTVESRFADDRTYTWQGKKVDEQTHLGFDLAKLAHSPIPASNDGKVVFAELLGIYGNCIVIDHGFGLQTIYGHLSEFRVKKGDMVKKGQIIGLTGSTGMAGGDHLHFTMQVDGVQVNSVEWWDPHWVKDRILSKLGETMTDAGTDAYAEAVKAHRRERKGKRR